MPPTRVRHRNALTRIQASAQTDKAVPYVAVVLTGKEAPQCASREALEGIVRQVHSAYGAVSLSFLLVKLVEEVQLEYSREFERVRKSGAAPTCACQLRQSTAEPPARRTQGTLVRSELV